MIITKLRIEGRAELLGLDKSSPEFSWSVEGEGSKYQTAYQYEVSRTSDFKELCYDSGKILSNQQAHISYSGTSLMPKTRYYIRVRLWDEVDSVSPYSNATYFETGLLGENFVGEWIEPQQEEAYQEPECMHIGQVFMPREVVPIEERLRPCQYLRKEFQVKKTVCSARLYATSHGIYEIYLNGNRVSNQYFAPEITSYEERQFYQTYDITSYITEGTNGWGVVLADGWHIGRIGLSGDSCQYENKLAFLGQIEVHYLDGTSDIIPTDASFQSNIGKQIYADLFMGEMHDMSLDKKDFSKSSFEASSWNNVIIVNHKKEHLIAQSKEPVVILEKVLPIRKLITNNQDILLDFGKVVAGFVTMKAKGQKGSKITLEFCEQLDENGNFWNHIVGRNNDQLDGMILSGEGEELFAPSFTYHGFRYVKVTGYPGELDISSFTAMILGTELERTLEFVTSNPLLNQLQENIVNSQTGNMISLPTDCPQREKSGFTGDIQVYGVTGCYNMDLEYFLADWLTDVRASQCETGEVPNISPNYPKMKLLQQRTNGCQSAAGWGDACVILPWILYKMYDNKDVLSKNYEMMKRWVDYIQSESPDYIWRNDTHFGDWLTPSLTKYGMNIDESFKELRYMVATCYYAYSVSLLSMISKLLGCESKEKEYKALEEKIKAAYIKKFVVDNRLSLEMQGMYVLALEMEMIPKGLRMEFASHLNRLVQENNYCLDTGFMSVRYLLPILYEYGYVETAKMVLYQTQCPSWLYQVKHGATSIWEKWDAIMPDGKVNAVSFNHYAFGCVGEFLYEHIVGLKPIKQGFQEFKINPDFRFGLDDVNFKYQSHYGSIEIHWKKKEEKYIISIKVPFNTTAHLTLEDQLQLLEPGEYLFEIEDRSTNGSNCISR